MSNHAPLRLFRNITQRPFLINRPSFSSIQCLYLHSSTSHSSPKTNLPLSPAVSRILNELGVEDSRKIKGTGLRGRLTKGDVLAYFKKASSPDGTAQKMIQADREARLIEKSKLKNSSSSFILSQNIIEETTILDGLAVRRFITDGLSDLTNRPSILPSSIHSSFDSILEDYSSLSDHLGLKTNANTIASSSSSFNDKYFDGLESL